MHAKDVIHSDFLKDLGTDFVAATANGHVVSRASTRASLENATKNLGEPVHIFSAADFAIPSRWLGELKPELTATSEEPTPMPDPVNAGLDAVAAQQAKPVDEPVAPRKAEPKPDAHVVKAASKK